MPLENFNSLFELTAVFNFAYVLSNDFVQMLNLKIIRHFQVLLGKHEMISSLTAGAKESLLSVTKKVTEITTSENNLDKQLHQLKTELDNFEKLNTDLKTDCDNLAKDSSVVQEFPFLCLYAGLYSIFVLLLNGFSTNSDRAFINESYLILNFLSIVFLMYCYLRPRIIVFQKISLNYSFVIATFVIIVVMSVCFYFINKNIIITHCPIEFDLSVPISSIFIISSHFIFYYFRAHVTAKENSINIDKDFGKLEIDIKHWNTNSVDDFIGFISGYNKYIVKTK
ncbi:MAG: hypothetical protein Q8L88_03580 [Bacteroidota bacterium]|nr:hypothetical protein [Bacteroidota bacterium]